MKINRHVILKERIYSVFLIFLLLIYNLGILHKFVYLEKLFSLRFKLFPCLHILKKT